MCLFIEDFLTLLLQITTDRPLGSRVREDDGGEIVIIHFSNKRSFTLRLIKS